MSKTAQAFFSYSRDDSAFALRLASDLRENGATVWIDQLDIEPGQRWDSSVEEALAGCPRMLVILSPSSVESQNVMDEVSFALEKQKAVIPVLYRDCNVPFRLRRVQYINFRSDYDNGLRHLLKVLAGELQAVASTAAGDPAPAVAPAAGSRDVPHGRVAEDTAETERHAEQERSAAVVAPKQLQRQHMRGAVEAARKVEQQRSAAVVAPKQPQRGHMWVAAAAVKQERVERVAAEAVRKVDQERSAAVVAPKQLRRRHMWVAAAAVILVASILALYRMMSGTAPPALTGEKEAVAVAPVTPSIPAGTAGATGTASSSSIEMEMIKIPTGEFAMGSPSSETARDHNEGPVHKVSVPAFELGKFEVTVEQFKAYLDDNTDLQLDGCSVWKKSWVLDPKLSWKSPGFTQSSKDPVVCVSLVDARGYVRWLNKKSSKKGYRLPSESEWEYAARAGTSGPRYWPRDGETCDYAVTTFESAVCKAQLGRTMPVGQRKENGFNLHDMLGNAWEWTEDCWNDSYSGAPINGEVWQKGNCNSRVVRGGSWFHGLGQIRSAFRRSFAPQFRSNQIGFRIARSLP